MGEVIAAVDEGTPIEVAERAARRRSGLPMSPFVLLQLVGPAVAPARRRDAARRRSRTGSRVSANLAKLVEAGKPGVYLRRTSRLDPEAVALLERRRRAVRPRSRCAPARCDALAEEIRLMLDEGVVADGRRTSTCA